MFFSRENVWEARNKGDLILAISYLLNWGVDLAIHYILYKFYMFYMMHGGLIFKRVSLI